MLLFCPSQVIRNARRSNKYCFELAMSEGRSCVLASESIQEQDGWIGLMTAILTSNKNALEAKKSTNTVTSPDGMLLNCMIILNEYLPNL